MLPTHILAATTFGAALLLSAARSASATETPLEMAVATGAHLFATATFGGNGRTCESLPQGRRQGAGPTRRPQTAQLAQRRRNLSALQP